MDIEKYPITTYPMGDTKKCGLGILIVNQNFKDPTQNRDGSEEDMVSFGKLMEEELSLELYTYKDLKLREMIKLLRYVSGKGRKRSSKYPRLLARHSVLVVAISSHGAREGVYTSDLKLLKFHKMKSFFNPIRCPIMIGKPKVFLLNCCRLLDDGLNRNEKAFPLKELNRDVEVDGVDSDGQQSEDEKERDVASEGSDFITVNFCTRGMASFRHKVAGSLVINEFYKYFKSHGHSRDFQLFMTGFTRRIKSVIYDMMGADRDDPITQCPEVTTSLDRLLYFPEKDTLGKFTCLQISNTDTVVDVSSGWEYMKPEEENAPERLPNHELSYSISTEVFPDATTRDASETRKSHEVFEDRLKKKDVRFHPYRFKRKHSSTHVSGRRDGIGPIASSQ